MVHKHSDRRSVLKGIGTIGIVGVAGCMGGDDEGGDDEGGNGGDFPSEDITWIIPFSEGGGSDIYARQVGSVLSDHIDADFMMENIEGAGSLRGVGEAYHRGEDGHTIVIFNPPSTPTTWLVREEETDWDIEEFRGVAQISIGRLMVVANNDVADELGLEELSDVIDAYNSGELTNLGGQALGGWNHVAALTARDDWEWDWAEYVGYDGAGPALQAVVSGEIPVGINTDSTVKSAVEGGEVTEIATFSSEESLDLPDVPTAPDQGLEGIDWIGNLVRGVWAPPGTPDEHIEVLTNGIEEAIESDEMQEWSEETERNIEYGSPEEIEEALQANLDQIRENIDVDALREEA